MEVIVFVMTFFLWFIGFHFNYFTDEFYAFLFLIIILNCATKVNPIIKLENQMFNFLGKISYGLYAYHWIIIVLIMETSLKFSPNLTKNMVFFNMLIYSLGLSLTIIISHFSYNYFESFFLKIKDRFN